MAAFLEISLLVVEVITVLITVPGYMFIVVVNILDWMKNRRLDISDQLISGISLSNFLHRLLDVSLDYIVFTTGINIIYCKGIIFLYLSLILCTLLFSTWLSIHFCLKIVNINHNLYISIQRMFPKMFPWILLPSVLASVLISTPAALRLTRTQLLNSTCLLKLDQFFLELLLHFTPYNVFSSLCLFLFFSSALNIILSLRRHINQIHNNSMEFSARMVEAHVTAMKTVISLLVFNLVYLILVILITFFHFSHLWIQILPTFFALSHILGVPILIRGSSKLQKKLRTTRLHCLQALTSISNSQHGN
ncbi:taste receptor type 2 member 2-like [Leptodactylus fuscus]